MEVKKVLLSIIIPTYNAADTIREAVESLLNQSLRDIEVICVDDGSTDETVEILKEYVRRDARVKVLQQNHQYAGNARNKGIDASCGQYLYFMDADDYVLDYGLEAAFDKCVNDDLDCLKFCSLTYDMKQQKYVASKANEFSSIKYGDYYRLLDVCEGSPLLRISVAPWSGLYKRDFVVSHGCRFNGLRCVNDRSFYTKIITNHPRIMCSLDRVVVHRINQDHSLVGTKADHFDCQIRSLQLTEAQLKADQVSRDIAEIIMRHEYSDTGHWYLRYASDPVRQEEMTRQIDQYINSKESDYSIILSDLMKRLVPGSTPEALVERKPIHCESTAPEVSVIVPIAEDERHLNFTLESLTNQTLEDLEFILVNNGSSKQALTIAREYALIDRRFQLEVQQTAGYGNAVNKGIEKARGKYVCIVRAGDMMETDMLEKLCKAGRVSHPDIIRADYDRFQVQPDGETKHQLVHLSTKQRMYGCTLKPEKERDVFYSPFSIWNSLYRKAFLDAERIRFNETPGDAFQQNGFWFLTLCKAQRIRFCGENLYHQRQNPAEFTDVTLRDADAMVKEYRWLYQQLKQDAELFQKFEKLYYNRKLNSLLLIWSRLGNADQRTFLRQIREEMRIPFEQDLLDRSRMNQSELDLLEQIMDDPEKVLQRTDITVIVLVENTKSPVQSCLKSIYYQTRARVDTVCVNCCSDEAGSDSLQGLQEWNDRVRVIQKRDRDLFAVLQEETECAKGDYILVTDPDILLETGMLDQAWRKARGENLDVLCFSQLIDAETPDWQKGIRTVEKEKLPEKKPFAGSDVAYDLFQVLPQDLSGKLYRKEMIRDKGLRYTVKRGGTDIPFAGTVLACADRIGILGKCPVRNPAASPAEELLEKEETKSFCSGILALRDSLREQGRYERFERDVINYAVHTGGRIITETGSALFEKNDYCLLADLLKELDANTKPKAYFYDAEDYETVQDAANLSPVDFLLKGYRRRSERRVEEKLIPMENKAITGSVSFKMGRMITWGPRKLRGGLRKIQGRFSEK